MTIVVATLPTARPCPLPGPAPQRPMSDPASPEPIRQGSTDCPRGSLLLAVFTLLMMVFGALQAAPRADDKPAELVATPTAVTAETMADGDAPEFPALDRVADETEHEAPGVEPEPEEELGAALRWPLTTRAPARDCGAASAADEARRSAATWSRQAARAPPRA